MTRLIRLYVISRRLPTAAAVLIVCAVVLSAALRRPWDAYGALQLPLVFETACACVIAVAIASPFGELERAADRRLPWLRMGTATALVAAAGAVLCAAGIGTHLDGGRLSVIRNLAGVTGIGLLCAALLGGALAWTGPAAYMLIGLYALYRQWHGPALSTPWLWPARPADDVGAGICAALVLAAGLAAVAARGARVRPE